MKRITALLLAFLMIFGGTVNCFALPEIEGESYAIHINPRYEGIVKPEDLAEAKKHKAPVFFGEKDYVDSVEEAGAIIREQLKERKKDITVYFSAGYYSDAIFNALFDEALVHTGNPTEGDYLAWQYAGWQGSCSYRTSGGRYLITFNYTVTYYTSAEEEDIVDARVEELLDSLNLVGKSDYEKVKAVYDYICANVTYDYVHLDDDTYKKQFTAYAALIDGTAVCQGYANLFYRLTLEEGVDSRIITGFGGGGPHAWNIVGLGDYYYNLDSTWDAGYKNYEYFLVSEANFPDHYRNFEYETIEFHKNYPMDKKNYEPSVSEDSVVASGYCGSNGDGTNLEWVLDSKGTLTISGDGDMASYDSEWDYETDTEKSLAPWAEYSEKATSLVIEEGVRSIGSNAFRGMKNLSGDLILRDGLSEIDFDAFSGCSGFTGNLVIPDSVDSIGAEAFKGCSGFTGDLVIPGSIMVVEHFAFQDCLGFDGNLVIKNGVRMIDMGAFSGCSGFTGDLIIPESVTDILYDAFERCGFDGKLVIGENVKTIEINAFRDCINFTGDLVIPESVTNIGNDAFARCGFDGKLVIGENVKTIGAGAFCDCINFTGDLIIPESVTNIRGDAFARCGIDDFYFEGDAPDVEKWSSYWPSFDSDDTIYYPAGNSTWEVSDGKWNGYTAVPVGDVVDAGYCGAENEGENITWVLDSEGTLTIKGEGAMADYGHIMTGGGYFLSLPPWSKYRKDIKHIVIEEGVTDLGFGAFSSFSALESVSLPEGLEDLGVATFVWSELGGRIEIPSTVTFISDAAFRYCKNITEVVLHEGITEIERSAFEATGLSGVLSIPENIKTIGNHAFAGCEGITSVVITDGTETIGEEAFENCCFLTDVQIGAGTNSIGAGAFGNCSNLTVINVSAENENYSSYLGALYTKDGKEILQYPAGKTSISWKTGVEKIGAYAFNGCNKLTGGLEIPGTVRTIGDYAFQYCTGFNGKLELPNGIKSIGSAAFYNCTGFTGDLILPDSITSIGSNAFYYCEGFDGKLVLPKNLTEIENFVFWRCDGLKGDIIIPEGVKTVGEGAFMVCYGFDGKLVLPENLVTIETLAFEGCRNLTGDLVIPETVTSIGGMAFYGCGIDDFYFEGDAPAVRDNLDVEPSFDDDIDTLHYYKGTKGWNTDANGLWNGYKLVCEGAKDPAVVTIGTAEGKVGGTVEIPVVIENNPGFASVLMSVKYDKTVLTLKDIELGMATNCLANIKTGIIAGASANDVTGNGTLFTLVFEIAEEAEEGNYDVNVEIHEFYNAEDDEVFVTSVSGVVGVYKYFLGDANGDGVVSSRDATRVLQYIVYEVDESQIDLDAADYNKDGKVSSRDATAILKAIIA